MPRTRYTPATPDQKAAFEEMLRLRQPPIIKGTDSKNFQGLNPFPNMPEFMRQHYLKQARSMGIEPNGKIYKMGLVRPEYAGRFDPEALVDSTSQIKGTLEQRGWGCEGMVDVKAPEAEVEQVKPEVAEDLVEEHTVREIVSEGITEMKKAEFLDRKEKKRAQLRGTNG